MTYGSVHGTTRYPQGQETVTTELGSQDFFSLADERLFSWNQPLHDLSGPFGKIFAYDKYRGKEVLEIGCGMGCMASLWSSRGAHVTAVDLNPVAVEQTQRRFKTLGHSGTVRQEDARKLSFSSASFDFVYSWGVLHHSPDLGASIQELLRVLRPGGEFGVMLYHRHSLWYLYHVLYLEGFLHREIPVLKPLELASRYGDGSRHEGNPHTWPITRHEAVHIFSSAGSAAVKVRVLGTELDSSFRFMLPGFSFFIPTIVKKAWARRWGWSLWITGTKPEPVG